MANLDLLTYLEEFISPERKARFLSVLEERTRLVTVVLEDVFQLHNTSAVMRSCDVFGIQDVHIIEGRFGERLDKNIAMGAQQWVSLHRYQSSEACISSLREKGYSIVATSPEHEDAIPLPDFELKGKTAVFFGTEKEGLSDTVFREADSLIQIPMKGFTRSLNISVSVAVVLYELSRGIRKATTPWKLSEEEKMELRMEWAKKSIKGVEEILARYSSNG